MAEPASSRVFEVAPLLADGRSLFDPGADPVAEGLAPFRASEAALAAARDALAAAGLTVVATNAHTLSVLAPEGWAADRALLRDTDRPDLFRLPGAPAVAGLAAVPPTGRSTDPLPPSTPYFCLRAPVDMLTALDGTRASITGHDGRGIRIAVIDSGCDRAHPYFRARRSAITVVCGPDEDNPEIDAIGHGTMICATIVSIAPLAELTVIKTSDALSLAAFKTAAAMRPRPHVIQNTWGHITTAPAMTPYEKAVFAAITDAAEAGIVPVFAAGNQKIIFPPQVPAAFAAGGAYVDAADLYRASDYASGYASALFPGRIVPDFCGLVGPAPNGVYIMLPTAPGSAIDRAFAEYPYPRGDGGLPDDGWVVISGTSSASAQVSGLAALLLQARPGLEPAALRALIAATARRIDVGVSAQGHPSGPPYPNRATGWGLLDIGAALAAAGSPD
ncbi:S8 family serine peptidase [Prosthecomicrobium pneumaticum]|uniref:Subtilisin family serine protease n=1 Tax=Prosthecomicrobium pneumaticum TaxID=81895 RepID=A0A7W9FLY5_9HYPH|nr:S8 family serine peptidase [Prosthecomicrobium pneumaticum]MBB5753124.1 subtilisin family serine protease [Prosthecomicrobium pneumaticum]